MMPIILLCDLSLKRFNTTPKWNVLMLGVLLLLLILGVIMSFIVTRNHLQKTGDCWPPFCLHSSTAALT